MNYSSKILHCTVVQAAKGEIGRKRSTEWLLMEHLHLSSPLGDGNGDDDGGQDGGGGDNGDHDGELD